MNAARAAASSNAALRVFGNIGAVSGGIVVNVNNYSQDVDKKQNNNGKSF